jgi:RHS repeat-associated protein
VGRLMHKLYGNGTGVGYNYDAVGRMTSEYDLTWTGTPPNYTITWTGNTITYQYDAAGRLTKKTLPNGRSISYTYDSAGRRTQMTDYFGSQTNYSYDALGRLTSLSNPYGEVTTFQYDANSRLIRKNLANGTYTTYSYNSRGFLTGIYNYKSNGTLITYATYTYDAVGNRLSMSTPEGNYTYSYDAIYRLTGEVNPIGGTYSYTYDAVGNRLSMTHNGQTINYVYDAGNKLLQAGNTTFTYDGNGNMVSKTENGQTTTYVYNYEDKMVQVNLPNGASVVYNYDHEGKITSKTTSGVAIDYYFDDENIDLIVEAQGSSILAYYTQGAGLISQRRDNASYFYHYDGLGSTKASTDANQNVRASTIYDAWGNILQASGTIMNPCNYAGGWGYYQDNEVGLYLLTYRWYDPGIGRFLTRDNIFSDEDYIYCQNNPVNDVDPLGLVSKKPKPNPKPSPSISEFPEDWQKCAEAALEKFCKGMKLEDYKLDGKEVNIDWKVIRCMIWVESRDDPNKVNKSSHAKGLMQIIPKSEENCPEALKRMGIKHCYNWKDPCDNITCGVFILCRTKGGSLKKYGTIKTKEGLKAFDKCMHSYNP